MSDIPERLVHVATHWWGDLYWIEGGGELTDDAVEPPTEQLNLLHATVARMKAEAEQPREKFLADLVARRVSARDSHVVYDVNPTGYGDDYRFYIWDLDPDRDEFDAWIVLTESGPDT